MFNYITHATLVEQRFPSAVSEAGNPQERKEIL